MPMRDFTLKTYHLLLSALKEKGYQFQTFRDFLKDPTSRCVILRHDVDARKMNSLTTAQLENELGIRGTYYFRIVPDSFDEEVIREVAGLGHEVGYHYEDVSSTALRQKISVDESRLVKEALSSFTENLEKLRRIVPVKTVCMHGSPLSKWDNRLLWKYYDYRDFGIVGEPYFDTDFGEVLYLTDTGRRWDGQGVSIRDKVEEGQLAQGTGLKAQGPEHRAQGELRSREQKHPAPCSTAEAFFDLRSETKQVAKADTLYPATSNKFHSTFDIINAARGIKLPDNIMLTIHPQRWDDRMLPWIRELVWQNIKNIVKRAVTGGLSQS